MEGYIKRVRGEIVGGRREEPELAWEIWRRRYRGDIGEI